MAAHVERAAGNTMPLNTADQAFRDLCERLLDPHRSELAISKAARFRLEMVLRAWKQASKSGANLIGCDFAQKFAGEVSGHCDIAQMVRPDIAALFTNIPAALKEFVRLNFFVPFEHVDAMLEALLVDEGEILQWVNRVEISAWPNGMDQKLCPPFPTLMLYIGLDEPCPTTDSLLRLLDICRTATIELTATTLPSNLSEYAIPVLPFVNVTQGYRLYKRYLRALGLLDEVYDPNTTHAFVQPHQASDVAFCAAVRSVTRTASSTDIPW